MISHCIHMQLFIAAIKDFLGITSSILNSSVHGEIQKS